MRCGFEWCVRLSSRQASAAQIFVCNFRKAHEPLARKAGVSSAEIHAIHDISATGQADSLHVFSPLMAAAMNYVDASTLNIIVEQKKFDALKAHLNDQQLVEVAITVGAFNMIGRMLVALDVEDMNAEDFPLPLE